MQNTHGGKWCNGFLCSSLRLSSMNIPFTNSTVAGLGAGAVFGGHLFCSLSYQLHSSNHLRHSDISIQK